MINYIKRLMMIFNKSFIDYNNQIILIPETNLYFRLDDIKNELDLKAKLLEWCSRDASKSMHYQTKNRNVKYQDEVRNKINLYLETLFNREDMELIYQELGNNINRDLTIKFINSNYDMSILKGE